MQKEGHHPTEEHEKKSVIANVCLQIGLASVAPAATLACPPLACTSSAPPLDAAMRRGRGRPQMQEGTEGMRSKTGREGRGRPGMRGIEELLTGEGGPQGPRPPAKERTTQGGTPRRPRSGQGRHGSGEGARESEPQRPPATTNRRRRRPSSLACTRRFFSMSFLSSLHPPPLCVFSARAAVAPAAWSQALHLDRLIRCILSS